MRDAEPVTAAGFGVTELISTDAVRAQPRSDREIRLSTSWMGNCAIQTPASARRRYFAKDPLPLPASSADSAADAPLVEVPQCPYRVEIPAADF
jgi:hypothetical protein